MRDSSYDSSKQSEKPKEFTNFVYSGEEISVSEDEEADYCDDFE
jgi:hypothetical protein